MFGGNITEMNSFFLDNFHQRGGTITTTQMASAKILNCTLINQTSFNSGFILYYKIFKFEIGGSFFITDNSILILENTKIIVNFRIFF